MPKDRQFRKRRNGRYADQYGAVKRRFGMQLKEFDFNTFVIELANKPIDSDLTTEDIGS